MKNWIGALFTILLFSCIDKKAKLVALQKQIKDSLDNVDNRYSTNLLIRSITVRDSISKQNPNFEKYGLLDDAVMLDTLRYKLSDMEMRKLSNLHFILKDKYDSLEFEIKKF